MRMALREFYAYRCSDFFQAATDFIKHVNEQNQFNFETTRLLATTLVNIQLPKADRITAQELWANPFDKEDAEAIGPELTDLEQTKLDAALQEALKE